MEGVKSFWVLVGFGLGWVSGVVFCYVLGRFLVVSAGHDPSEISVRRRR